MPRANVAAGQGGEALLLERLELARRELELLRDVGEREAAAPRARRQAPADAGHRGCSRAVNHIGLAAAPGIPSSPGKRRRSWLAIACSCNALAHPALDAQREPQRLGGRRHQLVVARHQLARLADVALAVADLAELERATPARRARACSARSKNASASLSWFMLHRADAGGGVGAPRRGVKRVADRLQEVLDRRRLAPGLAQEPAVVVVDVGVVRRQAQRALEALLGAGLVLQLHVHQAVHAVRRRIVGSAVAAARSSSSATPRLPCCSTARRARCAAWRGCAGRRPRRSMVPVSWSGSLGCARRRRQA